jgi:hypothetical protein
MKTLTIPNDATVVCVDDSTARRAWFLSRYRVPGAYLASDCETAIRVINQCDPSVVFLDYDLIPPETSEAVARHLANAKFEGTRIIIVSQNPFGQEVLRGILKGAEIAPFGSFELVRRTMSTHLQDK